MNRFSDTPLREDPDFQAWYDRHLSKLDGVQESARAGAWRASLLRGAVAVPLLIALLGGGAYLYASTSPLSEWLSLVTVILVLIVLVVWVIDPARNQAEVTKARITPALMAWFGDFRFASKDAFPLGNFQDWGLIPRWSEETTGDIVEGSHRGVPFRFAELELVERHETSGSSGSGSRSRTRSFGGLYAEYGLEEAVPALTVYLSRNPFWSQRAERNGWSPLHSGHDSYEAYTSGDPATTPGFPESLPDILTGMALGLGAKHVAAVFEGQRLVVLLQGASNVFEPPVMRAADLYEQAESLRRQLGLLLSPVAGLPIPATVEIRDESAAVDQAANDASAEGKVDRLGEGPGCLFMMIASTAIFLAYGLLLRNHEMPGIALLTGLAGGLLIAWSAWDGLEALRGKPVPWFSMLARLALALGPLWFLLR